MAKQKRGVLSSGILRDRFPVGEHRETKLNEICEEAKERFPFYFALPHNDPVALLAWRIYVRQRCLKDLAFRKVIWECCRRDVAFFAVTFCFIFEPRPTPRRLPLTLWTDQTSILAWLEEIFGVRSAGVNKTRGIGMSWLTTVFIFHKWLFVAEVKIAVLTKDKDLLSGPDSNSLMGKFVYLLDNLPEWAKYTSSGAPLMSWLGEKTTFTNISNAAVIQGFVSTSMKLRQLRFTMIFADEFAFYDRTDQEEWLVSANGCSNCLLMVSTWNDFGDAFDRLMFEEESAMLRISAYWWNNYERWQGAYVMGSGVPTRVDKDFEHEPHYKFGEPEMIEEGTPRSPWVDAELSKPGINRLKTLRDLYGKSICEQTNSFFDRTVQKCVKASILTPAVQGLLDTSLGVVKIIPTLKSNIRLWGGVPEKDRGPYTFFCDLSHGVGGAYAVCCGMDKTGEQVLEYGTNDLSITLFAANVVLLARWLAGKEGDGHVVIDAEANGPLIKPFMNELQRMGYANIHESEVKSNTVMRVGEVPKYLGTVNRDAGIANFREMERAILSMECVVRSQLIADDMRICGKDEDGRPLFPENSKQGHGDFCHSAGGCWWRARSRADLAARAEIDQIVRGSARPDPNPWDSGRKLWSAQYN